jgi:hypothetical protein
MTDSPAPPLPIHERLAALEERTAPKPKTVMDRLKEWGGVASLTVALLYSFPLGIWDRFVVPGERQRSEEFTQLRRVIDQVAGMLIDGGRALDGAKDPQMQDIIMRSTNTRIMLALHPNEAAFARRAGDFTAMEQVAIASYYQLVETHRMAVHFADVVVHKPDAPLLMRAEAFRVKAKSLFLPSDVQSLAGGRVAFRDGLALLANSRSPQELGTHFTLTSEWALFELTFGDWKCGEDMLVRARAILSANQLIVDPRGIMTQLLEENVARLSPSSGQAVQGCA